MAMQMPPGPDSMLVMARGIGQGRGVALFTVLGMTAGAGMVQLPLIALGVSTCAATIKVRLSVNQDETRRRGCDEGRA
jgi:threonine/homoserine/homoserine lactone efflux protein